MISILIGSAFGRKSRIIGDYLLTQIKNKYPQNEVNILDLADFKMEFSDGRNFQDYQGDTAEVINLLMNSETIMIITPIYQASIPGALKNVFDLLPEQAFRDKVVSMVGVAGSEKHFLVLEQQLKPILAFMKAQLSQNYVFLTGTDFLDNKIANDEILFRLDRFLDETLNLSKVYHEIQAENDAKYDF